MSDKCDLPFANGRFKERKHLYEALLRTGQRAIGNTRNAENCLWWAWHGNSTNSWKIFLVTCELNVGSVRPVTGRTQEILWNVCKIISKVQRSITSEIACRLDFSYGTCQRILKHIFNMRVVSRNLYRGCLPMNRRNVILLSLKICPWTHTFLAVNTQLPNCEHTPSLLWTHLPDCEYTPFWLWVHTFLWTHNFLTVNTRLPYCEHTPSLLWTHTFLTMSTPSLRVQFGHLWFILMFQSEFADASASFPGSS